MEILDHRAWPENQQVLEFELTAVLFEREVHTGPSTPDDVLGVRGNC